VQCIQSKTKILSITDPYLDRFQLLTEIQKANESIAKVATIRTYFRGAIVAILRQWNKCE